LFWFLFDQSILCFFPQAGVMKQFVAVQQQRNYGDDERHYWQPRDANNYRGDEDDTTNYSDTKGLGFGHGLISFFEQTTYENRYFQSILLDSKKVGWFFWTNFRGARKLGTNAANNGFALSTGIQIFSHAEAWFYAYPTSKKRQKNSPSERNEMRKRKDSSEKTLGQPRSINRVVHAIYLWR
jgi:hypothetical protein